MKNFCKYTLFLLLLSCIIFSSISFNTAANAGKNCLAGGVITREVADFILDRFSDCVSPEDLADRVLRFALENFVSDPNTMTKPQTVNNHRFIFENDFHGVCMDFSTFVQTVFQLVCRYKGWDNIGCHIALGYNFNGSAGHAVNYISVGLPNGGVKIYALDTTWYLNRYETNRPLQALSLFFYSFSHETVSETIKTAFQSQYKYRFNFIV